jgi:hypothetical protein
MATTRGFVERIEVGRAGLVTIGLINATGRADYVVSDIDGDPERFNERLTKVAVCRDAMNRAEPVEIDFSDGKAGNEIERVARITRDELAPPSSIGIVGGLLLRVVVQSRNAVDGVGELHDDARILLIDLTGTVTALRLDLQAPERLVVTQQLEIIRAAWETGTLVQFLVDNGTDGKDASEPSILAVWTGDGAGAARDDGSTTVSAFVESLGVIPATGSGAIGATLAVTEVTTAPEFTGDGNTVDPALFDPQRLVLYVARGSVPYALIEAGLRDNVRMRLRYITLTPVVHDKNSGDVRFQDASAAALLTARYGAYAEAGGANGDGTDPAVTALLVSAELLAPLASASRPVWLHIDREMLDRGPDADCTPGLPSSSLRPRSLRDLRIPYPAEWIGRGCFNHGVYRFQLVAPAGSSIRVDGEGICLYDTGGDKPGVVGYSCLDGDHVVTVVIPEYLCDTAFDLDVYRIR